MIIQYHVIQTAVALLQIRFIQLCLAAARISAPRFETFAENWVIYWRVLIGWFGLHFLVISTSNVLENLNICVSSLRAKSLHPVKQILMDDVDFLRSQKGVQNPKIRDLLEHMQKEPVCLLLVGLELTLLRQALTSQNHV